MSVRWQKMAPLVLLKGWFVGWAKPNVPFVLWQFKIFCMVGIKLKHRRAGNEIRLLVVRLLYRFYVRVPLSKWLTFFSV